MRKVFFVAVCYLVLLKLALCSPRFKRTMTVDRLDEHFDRRLLLDDDEPNKNFDRRLFLDDNEPNKHFDRRLFLENNKPNKHLDRKLFLDEEFSGSSENTVFDDEDVSGGFDDVTDGSGGFSGDDVSDKKNFFDDCVTKDDKGFLTTLKKILSQPFRDFNKGFEDKSN